MQRTILMAAVLLGLSHHSAEAAPTWNSGSSGYGASEFAGWRGVPLGLATGFAPKDSWEHMLSYASGDNPRRLHSMSLNVSIGLGLFPRGSNVADCAANKYADNHRSIGSRLAASGVGDAEIRLGWEASNRSFPWTAVGVPPELWKACFTNAANALKTGSPSLRISWHMAKKGKISALTLWPDAAPITNIGVSHYDDKEARYGTELTKDGSPWGLRAWLAFAQSKGKGLELAEWGVGRVGDDPDYIQKMYDFFTEAGPTLAHEGYLNSAGHELYAKTRWPKSSALYRSLF